MCVTKKRWSLGRIHMKCQCQILNIHWSQHVTNAKIFARTGLPPVMDFMNQKTSFVSIRPHSSAHSGDSSTQRLILPSWPSIRSFTWQGLETSSWPSSRALDRPTPQRHWICSCQPLETGHPTGPWWSDASWLCDDDDDDDYLILSCFSFCIHSSFYVYCAALCVRK